MRRHRGFLAVPSRWLPAAAILLSALPTSGAAAPPPPEAVETLDPCLAEIEAGPGKFCQNMDDCMCWCGANCTFDPTKWVANARRDQTTVCQPQAGPGLEPPELVAMPDDFRHIARQRRNEQATQAVVDALYRLDEQLEGSANRSAHRYSVRILSCYRPHDDDTTRECSLVLKARHMLARVGDDAEKREHWLREGNPVNKGLAWPGVTPHSQGFACDMVLLDSEGDESFGVSAGVNGSPRSTIDPRLASRMMDEELTSDFVGARRLSFEAWHYEWGNEGAGSRCRHPDCADNHWPIRGRP